MRAHVAHVLVSNIAHAACFCALGTQQMLDVIDFCHEHPEIRSWLDYFDDPAEEETVADREDGADERGVVGAGVDKDILG